MLAETQQVPVPLAAGPRVAMVGAGQLAQMTHQAAVGLGVDLTVLASGAHDPAVIGGAEPMFGSQESLDNLRAFAYGADLVTFDHEHVPPVLLTRLEQEGHVLLPSPSAQLLGQDKLHARTELARRGFPVPPFAVAHHPADAVAFAERHGWPIMVKATRGGYDGRCVEIARDLADFTRLFNPEAPPLMEPKLDIDRELSVIVARSTAGEAVTYPVTETIQRDGMCRETLTPAPISEELAIRARELALAITDTPGAVGVIAVELFVVGGELLVNELALRPHNSGHFTIEGAVTSQFEQHLRGVLGWPLGATSLTAPACVMVNVVGPADGSDPRNRLDAALGVSHAHVHLYSKEAAPGRKLGHVTACGQTINEARTTARKAAALLEGRRR